MDHLVGCFDFDFGFGFDSDSGSGFGSGSGLVVIVEQGAAVEKQLVVDGLLLQLLFKNYISL